MRPAKSSKKETNFFDIGGFGDFQSLILGGDYCAEHEWGIRSLEEDLGIQKNGPPGIGRRIVPKEFGERSSFKIIMIDVGTKLEPQAIMIGTDKYNLTYICKDRNFNFTPVGHGLFLGNKSHVNMETLYGMMQISAPSYFRNPETGRLDWIRKSSKKSLREAWMNEHRGVYGSWSERDFGVIALGDEEVKKLSSIFDGFQVGNIAVSLSPSKNPFGRGGLAFTLVDRLTDDLKNEIVRIDEEYDQKQKEINGNERSSNDVSP